MMRSEDFFRDGELDVKLLSQRMPEIVRFETEENNKNGYQEIQEIFFKAGKAAELWEPLKEQERTALYMRTLSVCAPLIDKEVFDHYKNLESQYRRMLGRISGILERFEPEYRDMIRESIKRACDSRMVSAEKYRFVADKEKGQSEVADERNQEEKLKGSFEDIEFQVIFKSSRRAVVELLDQGIVWTQPYELYLNGSFYMRSNRVVQSFGGLKPDTEYKVQIRRGGGCSRPVCFSTSRELFTMDVREFGAKGDGKQDDTAFIQAAINCCPEQSRVYIPEGTYRVGALFLKSGITVELAKGAVLSAVTDRSHFPILPGLMDSFDEKSEYNLGTWEGNPLEMFASLITGIGVRDVVITGEGTLEGNGSYENWWREGGRKKTGGAFRPRMIFLNRCENITVQGLKIQNSPAWTIHPYFSNHTRWIDLDIQNPKKSPNTDGMDPESVDGFEAVGIHFSLGDDCIAVKSGKMYMGKTYKKPSKNIEIRQCHMQYGHGAVTLGSEIGAGVYHLYCHHCIFENTDRGLRVKTRRGRGRDSVVEDILFEDIEMDGVLTPFVVNCYYWCCDPDGHSQYVRSKEPLPVDDRTPAVRQLAFKRIKAKNCHVAASFIYGLPEEKIDEVLFEDVTIDFAENPKADYPAMMADVEPCIRGSLFVKNCKKLTLRRVKVSGTEKEPFELGQIDRTEWE